MGDRGLGVGKRGGGGVPPVTVHRSLITGHLPLVALAALVCSALLCGARAGEAPAPAEPPKPEPKAEKPANPFGEVKAARPDAVPGKLMLSDGKEHRGRLYLTRDKKLEIFQDARNEWAKLDLKELKSVAFKIESEEVVREWRWKTPGSDEKVETGRTKVDRKYLCTAVKADGAKIEGHVRGAPIYVDDGKEARRFMLLWNSPGDFDQKPADLVYVKEVVFGEEAAKEPEKQSLKVITVPKHIEFPEAPDKSDKSDRSDKAPAPEEKR